jgi:hypothetical protein
MSHRRCLSDEERAIRRREVHRRYRARNLAKVQANAKRYRETHREQAASTARRAQQKAHAEGRCINCGKPHKHISTKTKRLALRCFRCAAVQSEAQLRRIAAKKAAA